MMYYLSLNPFLIRSSVQTELVVEDIQGWIVVLIPS